MSCCNDLLEELEELIYQQWEERYKKEKREKIKRFFYNLLLSVITTLFISIVITGMIIVPWVKYASGEIALSIPIVCSAGSFISTTLLFVLCFINDDLEKDKK